MPVHLDLNDFSTQRQRRREFQRAVAGTAALGFQADRVFRAVVTEIDETGPEMYVLYRKICPVSRGMRSEGEDVRVGVSREPEHTSQQGTDHHGGGPDLVRGTRGQRLILIAGKNFGDVAKRAIEREQGVGAEIAICGQLAMVLVFANRRPTGEQRPYGAVVIPASA